MDAARLLVTALVIVLVVVRRFTGRPVKEPGRLWTLPAVLAFFAVAGGGLVAPPHPVAGALLLAAETGVAFGLGLLMGRAMTVWREPDGTPWAKGNRAVLALFALSLATRAGLALLGYAGGIAPHTGALLLTLAAWILAQGLVLAARVRRVPQPA
ncbi:MULTISPECIES: DUF1453 domain-containing protein [Streptomyces]|uniref:DUF1453 domain-containing protein n=1 Tax=Streptomyces katrae TaxID=68223 RepID=A0ABT7H633_9ACTN|nr:MULTISPECIES: DUF1453 domain-containing protein [Streptomyces]MDK9501356.1 DUF1453 domain-containing protein [Streptomyces katrae]GLX24108.1 hypothetical protein Slala01_77520 [Streptomyces lavendulae subsp. lavendulae]